MTVLPDDGLSLAAEFPDATHEQWQRLVEGVLRKSGKEFSGAAAEDALSTTLEDGLRTRPLYTARDSAPDPGLPGFALRAGAAAPRAPARSGWDVRQRHTALTDGAVLADLENGGTSLWLVLGEGGIPVAELDRALDGVYLDLAPVVLDAGRDTEQAAEALLRRYAEQGVAAEAVRGNLGGDPLGVRGAHRDRARLAPYAALAERCAEGYPGLRALTVDALPYHEAGGSAAQELGASLATGVAYLRELTEAGLGVEQAAAQLEFRYAATADQFLTIAKLRAARRLWARVAEVCGGARRGRAGAARGDLAGDDDPPRPVGEHAPHDGRDARRGVGGADSVTVLPFDHALGLPDAFARRIARNTSTILIEESHLARVIDPAGGSWYVERLTAELAEAAWQFFRSIERDGGQPAVLRSAGCAPTWRRPGRSGPSELAKRREPITGVSEFPPLAEKPVERAPAPEPPSGGLPRVRRDEAYEELRASLRRPSRGDRRPAPIYLATLRLPRRVHRPRDLRRQPLPGRRHRTGHRGKLRGQRRHRGRAVAPATRSTPNRPSGPLRRAARPAPGMCSWRAGASTPASTRYVFAGCDAVDVLSATLDRMGVS